MPEPLDPQIIDRYLAGDASPDDLDAVRRYRDQDPAWAASLDALRTELGANGQDAPPASGRRWDADAAWLRLQSRVGGAQSTSLPVHQHRNRRSDRRSFPVRRWLMAAGLVVAAGVAAWQFVAAPSAGRSQLATMHEVVTPNGARHTLTLDDGSRVTLNAGSRLRWAADFGTRARDVRLEGEAYFVVTHDDARPFRVHARGGIAHDLGTRFTVRAYPELPHLEVVVAEGSVSLRRDHAEARDSAILTVGQLGRLTPSGPPVVESNVPMDRWTAWTSGALVLEGGTLSDALPQLERWYDAQITVSDPRLAARRVSARFTHETLPEMLDALTLALAARWEQTGRSITISPAVR
ncbi:MAG: FecR protein [Geminicoccaceae bacterium]|nr:FecR protein [Geminicoccaceae bacterium]